MYVLIALLCTHLHTYLILDWKERNRQRNRPFNNHCLEKQAKIAETFQKQRMKYFRLFCVLDALLSSKRNTSKISPKRTLFKRSCHELGSRSASNSCFFWFLKVNNSISSGLYATIQATGFDFYSSTVCYCNLTDQ